MAYEGLPGGFVYDLARDGSEVQLHDHSTQTNYGRFSQSELDDLSSWRRGVGKATSIDNPSLIAIFTGPRTINGLLVSATSLGFDNTNQSYLEYSLNLNTLIPPDNTSTYTVYNATWSQIATWNVAAEPYEPDTRVRDSRLFSVSLSNVMGVRYRISGNDTMLFDHFTVWGDYLAEGLVPWHPTLDQPLSNDTNDLDRGAILVTAPPVIQQFRVKNTHGTSTALNVVIAVAPSDFGALDTETTFSTDNTNFQQTITLASLAPGTVSPIIYMKRGTPTDPASTVRFATVRATASNWS